MRDGGLSPSGASPQTQRMEVVHVRQKRRHPLWDIIVIVFACALIGEAIGPTGFGILAGVMVLLYWATTMRRSPG
ncbi:MAG: hypothetical protein ACRD6W_15715 [Nitrososphaerales archaeon]